MRLRPVGVLLVSLAVLALGACGDDDDETLSREQFVSQGNAICGRTHAAVETGAAQAFKNPGLVPTAEETEAFVEDTYEPSIRKELDELGDLKPTDDEEGRVKDILDAGKEGITEVNDNPIIILSREKNPMLEYRELAGAYGLEKCGRNTEKVERAIAGLK